MSPPPSHTTHRLKSLVDKPVGTLLVHEIYRSLQGESTFAGLPCVFVRLTSCHLRCSYCDTPFAFHQGEVMTLDAVLSQVREYPDSLVEVTGGEPLLQAECLPLMARLADTARTVLLETSGAIDTADVDPRVRIILDLKTPGSGEAAANLDVNLQRLRSTDELKVVVCDRADFDWAVEQIQSRRLIGRCPIMFSSAYGRVEPAELAAWILESGLPLRLQIQLHKLLWGAETRGV